MKDLIYFIAYPTGELLTFNSFTAASEYFYLKGKIPKSWIGQFNYIIHKLEKKGVFLRPEAEFLNKYGLSHSVFNVGCLQNLNAVFLFKAQFDKIQNSDDKNKVTTNLNNNNKNLNSSTIKNNLSTENSNKSKTKGLNTSIYTI